MTCIAPWYELNTSAPDNNVSACCYYGERDAFEAGEFPVEHYWNSPSMRALRRLQADPSPPIPNGCSNCYYFQNHLSGGGSYDNFAFENELPADITPAQLENWRLAQREYAERREVLECSPLKIFVNFGYTCNLSCKMCHQVPRRRSTGFVKSDSIYAWQDELQKSIEITVIGGEPFALPECVKFIRRFCADDRMDAVRMNLITNGTVLHKHMDMLREKRKITFSVSVDSISGGYESIRVGGRWDAVERNLLMIKEAIACDRPDWRLQTVSIIMKTAIPYLPEFARWHTKHGIPTTFMDFINFRGTEDAYYRENIIDQPHLLEEIPGWEDDFAEAIDIFKMAGDAACASSLEHFQNRVIESWAKTDDARVNGQRAALRNDWTSAICMEAGDLSARLTYQTSHVERVPAFDPAGSPLKFSDTRPGDCAHTEWIVLNVHPGSRYKLAVEWPKVEGETRQTHVVAQWHEWHCGDLDGFREYRETPTASTLVMTGGFPTGAKKLMVAVLPVGEQESVFPTRVTLEVDHETKLTSPDQVPVAGGLLGLIVARSSNLGKTVRALLGR